MKLDKKLAFMLTKCGDRRKRGCWREIRDFIGNDNNSLFPKEKEEEGYTNK